ncbi:hypothetical protein B0T25DRAFT_525875 [Lasiosphaeria hispida]|uniref:Uncharacterized protein n=1 Tax=Lasiosphaeria hispida TaxID=260671 RepID=A0AAJ0HUT3_9PEZI|nr:hypothetical protein B0T25DRAFT_525875 [Lasiosphaeria hispida]
MQLRLRIQAYTLSGLFSFELILETCRLEHESRCEHPASGIQHCSHQLRSRLCARDHNFNHRHLEATVLRHEPAAGAGHTWRSWRQDKTRRRHLGVWKLNGHILLVSSQSIDKETTKSPAKRHAATPSPRPTPTSRRLSRKYHDKTCTCNRRRSFILAAPTRAAAYTCPSMPLPRCKGAGHSHTASSSRHQPAMPHLSTDYRQRRTKRKKKKTLPTDGRCTA